MRPFQKSGFVARISSRITTVIRVAGTIKQTITDLMSHSQFHSLNLFILTHAWLNLWDKHMNWCWPSKMRDSPTHKEQRAQNTMSDQMPFPFNNFTYFFTLFSKFFSSFHHCTCSLSVSRQYLALDGIYHPLRAAFPNNSTLRRHFTKNRTPRHTGFSPSMTSCSKEHRQGTAPKLPSPNYNSGTEGTRFQIWAFAASLAVTKAIPVGFFSSAYWYA